VIRPGGGPGTRSPTRRRRGRWPRHGRRRRYRLTDRDRTAFLYRHADVACGYLCLSSRLVTGHRSLSAGYRLTTAAERVIRPCIVVVWV
jgi:hypothetical protein